MLTISRAVESNDLEQVKSIIRSGIKFTKGDSPLGLAAELGNVEIVEALVDAGCNVEWGGFVEPSPLCLAAFEGNTDVVQFLIEKQAKLNSKDADGFTPLMSAAANGHLEIVKLLIEAGAKINIQSEYGDFALLSASNNGHREIYEYLLQLTSAKLSKQVDDSLIYAEDGKPKPKPPKELTRLIDDIVSVVVKMYDRGSSIEKEMLRVHKSISKIVDYQAVDLNGSTALHHSVQNLEITKALLDSGFGSAINIQNHEGNTALISACTSNRLEVIKLLIDCGADTELKNLEGFTALITTVQCTKSNEIIKLLHEVGANLEAEDNFGNTALLIAYAQSKSKYEAEWSQPNVDLLKSLGVSTVRCLEIDFIDYALSGNNEKVIEFIQNGGNINCRGIRGVSAITAAIGGDRVDTLRILLNSGAVIGNISDAFCMAVYSGFTEIVKELIDRGIDVNAPDSSNYSIPLWRAIERNNIEMVEILIEAGAKVPKKGSTHGYVLKDSKVINMKIYQLLLDSNLSHR
jgi:ankyrin repeat protein